MKNHSNDDLIPWWVLVVIIVLAFGALHLSAKQCATHACPEGMQPRVVSHQCLCVTVPK